MAMILVTEKNPVATMAVGATKRMTCRRLFVFPLPTGG